MKISAVIPAYNAEDTIEKCVQSVLSQSYHDVEVIVVDDGSTDSTPSLLAKYGDSIQFYQQPNKGQAVARNTGVKNSSGDIVAYLDSDDYWAPDFCKEVANFFDENENFGAVMTAWERHMGDGTSEVVPKVSEGLTNSNQVMFIDDFYKFWVDFNNIQTGAIAIRRTVIEEAGEQLADLRVSQDWEYWLNVTGYTQWGFINKVLYHNNSREAAKGVWWTKYRKRRKLCPKVEDWERRIVTNIPRKSMEHYVKIRGQVAAGYAHHQLLGSKFRDSYLTTSKYGYSMPGSRLNSLLRRASNLGFIVYFIVAQLLIAKEIFKSFTLKYSR